MQINATLNVKKCNAKCNAKCKNAMLYVIRNVVPRRALRDYMLQEM